MRFKVELLGKLPFYGDILMNILIAEDPSAKTSCTNGRVILYNADYLKKHSEGERNYILMHEVMHILLLHCARAVTKDQALFNAAADVLVNAELKRLQSDMRRSGIAFSAPVEGIYAEVSPSETVENLYEKMLQDKRDYGDAESEQGSGGQREPGRGGQRNGGQTGQSNGGLFGQRSNGLFGQGSSWQSGQRSDGQTGQGSSWQTGQRSDEQTGQGSGGQRGQSNGGQFGQRSDRQTGQRSNGQTGQGEDGREEKGSGRMSESGQGGAAGANGVSAVRRLLNRLLGKGGRAKQKHDSPDARPADSPEYFPPQADSRERGVLRRDYESGLRLYTAPLPNDLVPGLAPQELEKEVEALLAHAAKIKERSPSGEYYISPGLYSLKAGTPLDWRRLLKQYLSEEEEKDETSYLTPDRRYLHTGMIVPGYGEREENPGAVWAFVDSSGSVSAEEMDSFLTQLLALVSGSRCRLSIAYWSSRVTDVYRGIAGEADIKASLPRHSGGTNINCVYDWIRENRPKADVFLILTDGYFGNLDKENPPPGLRRKTILVLSRNGARTPEMKKIGRIAGLK